MILSFTARNYKSMWDFVATSHKYGLDHAIDGYEHFRLDALCVNAPVWGEYRYIRNGIHFISNKAAHRKGGETPHGDSRRLSGGNANISIGVKNETVKTPELRMDIAKDKFLAIRALTRFWLLQEPPEFQVFNVKYYCSNACDMNPYTDFHLRLDAIDRFLKIDPNAKRQKR